MKVQRVRLGDHLTWLVLDDSYIPIQPVLSYLQFLDDLERSPNTIRNAAHHLKLFWEYLYDAHLSWAQIDVAHLAAFITWLRRSEPIEISLEAKLARRTNATIDQILSTVHSLYDFHMRLGTVPELPLYQVRMIPHRRYKSLLYGIAKVKPSRTRVVSTKREKRQVKTLTCEQVNTLLDACTHIRDKFLLSLMFQAGMRVGQVLGLRHEDVNVEDGEIRIVPRDDNPNGARAKTHNIHTIPVMTDLMQLYTDYLISDLSALEVDSLPDFVFVNLWEEAVGRPMTYASVMSLVHRLTRRTGITFTPHMLRHSRATSWFREDKMPLPVISRLLTHASIQTTNDIYLQLTKEDLKKALVEGKDGQHGTNEG